MNINEKMNNTKVGLNSVSIERGEDLENSLKEVTNLALEKDIEKLKNLIGVSSEILNFSNSCVGGGLRKGTLNIDNQEKEITHFAHMCRVATMVKNFFPEDVFNRNLATVHDIKEEPLPGKENDWENVNEISKIQGLSQAIDILTEIPATESEVSFVKEQIPEEFDAEYVAKYRNFIIELSKNWSTIGNLELCDRLDGAASFEYLNDSRYDDRRKYKALETFGRIWATIGLSDNVPMILEIKKNCRTWFEKFNVTETEVEKTSTYFKM